jgi:hypothetical protein
MPWKDCTPAIFLEFFPCKINDFLKKKKYILKNLKIHYISIHDQVGSQKYVRMVFFFLSYFCNSQIWLNQLTYEFHLGYTTKLKKTKRTVP